MLAQYVADVLFKRFCDSSSCPCYYWHHLCFYIRNALNFIIVTIIIITFITSSSSSASTTGTTNNITTTVVVSTTTTYFLTPWSRVLLEKLASLQLVKKFPAFYYYYY